MSGAGLTPRYPLVCPNSGCGVCGFRYQIGRYVAIFFNVACLLCIDARQRSAEGARQVWVKPWVKCCLAEPRNQAETDFFSLA